MCLVIKYPISACRKRRSVLRSPLVTCNKLIGIPSFVCIDVGEPMHAPREDQYTRRRWQGVHSQSALQCICIGAWRRLALRGQCLFLLRRARADRNAVCSLNPYRLRQINWILALECEMRSKDSAEREKERLPYMAAGWRRRRRTS
jgi:hypothetical protein